MPSWVLTLIAVVAVLVVLAASTVLYRRLLPSGSPIVVAVVVGGLGLLAWLLFVAIARPDVRAELIAPVAALAALAAFLATVVVRASGATAAGSALFALVWSLVVFAPTAMVAFTGIGPFGVRPIDQGGSLAVNVAAGASAFGVLVAAGRRAPRLALLELSPGVGSIGVSAFTIGWLGWLVGAELAINELTPVIVANGLLGAGGGIAGWLLVQRIRHQSTSLAAVAAGLISGLVGVTAGAPFYAPPAAAVVGILAGVFASVVSLRTVNDTGRPQWFIVGSHLVAGAVGLIVLALLASDLGFFFTGQYVFLRDQLICILLIGSWSAVVSMGLWWAIRRVSVFVPVVFR